MIRVVSHVYASRGPHAPGAATVCRPERARRTAALGPADACPSGSLGPGWTRLTASPKRCAASPVVMVEPSGFPRVL